jgi:hypothetical protein
MQQQKIDDGLNASLDTPRPRRGMGRDIVQNRNVSTTLIQLLV